jgi:aryl-alcohol dehydrogenase-like predicted oxidoreductase
MKFRQLGKSDLIVSEICFGCWQLSPRFWGTIELGDWKRALDRAFDLGVNFIDTADAYGDGYAEESLGTYLKSKKCRDRVVVATKFYWNFTRKEKPRHPDTSYDYILRACEASLRRLKTDRIDLYQIHAWDPLTRPDEVAAAFQHLKKDGKVRWFGCSNLNAEQMRMYLRQTDLECLQPKYNLITRDIEANELPLCLEKRIGVIAYSPLHNGLLTGKYKKNAKFDDFRNDLPLFRGKAFAIMLEAIRKLEPVATRYGLTIPQLALSWILTHPALTSAIVGVKKPEHIETAVPAAGVKLEASDWHAVAATLEEAKKKALNA